MSTLEAVARAIVRARHRTCCEKRDFSNYLLSDFDLDAARAALSALLPVSEEMGAILIEYVDWDHAGQVVIDGKGAFTAAINHILQEQ